MNKRISLSLTITLIALTAAVTYIITSSAVMHRMNQKLSEITTLSDKYARLEALDAEIRDNFYTTDIDEEKLMDEMLKGYVNGLNDPYSTYLTDEELSDAYQNNAGQFVGIGVSVLQTQDNIVTVQEVFPNSPAEAAGIAVGDRFLQVDDLIVSEDAAAAMDAVVGEEGTEVTVTLVRKDNTEYTVTIKRATVEEITVYSELLESGMGYIRISKFRTVTVDQFESAMSTLREQGAKGFVFDVRNNGGGLLSALEDITDPLLPEGQLAFSYNQEGNASPIIHSDENCLRLPYVILTNGGTASAAELFACLLRDYADAVLVGEKTFGKGIMQSTYSLPDGGGLTLTTATYSTGKTECYHGVGITPDVLSTNTGSETDTQLEDAKETLRELLAE